MTRLKHWIVAAAMGACGFAQAASPGPLGLIDNQLMPINAAHPVGFFTNIFEFKVSSDGFAGGILLGSPDPGMTILAIAFTDAADGLISLDVDGADGFNVLAALGAAGTYRFAVTGIGNPDLGGAYAGAIQTWIPNPVAVPEPGTYALLFAGLGLLAWRATKR